MTTVTTLLLVPCIVAVLVVGLSLLVWRSVLHRRSRLPAERGPVSVNYHFTRQCNYGCKFCFHTAKTSHVEPPERATRGLALLAAAGMRKINFSGGEPFLEPKLLGEMCRYSKENLAMESVSIVSNGSKIKREWLEQYGKFVDILAISCDSFNEDTNVEIGRGKGTHIEQLRKIVGWCKEFSIKFKLNTVVNIHNWKENMTEPVQSLQPTRWKVFQCLLVDGENSGSDKDLRNARELLVSADQFRQFLDRHRSVLPPRVLVPEDNQNMQASYLILDEYMRFLDCSQGAKTPSQSILSVGVAAALKESGFDAVTFHRRGGYYPESWSRDAATASKSGCASSSTLKSVDIEDIGDRMLAAVCQ